MPLLHCMVCSGDMPLTRARRGGKTCGDECAKRLNQLLRQEQAKKRCRLCGRRFRPKKELEPVRTPHTANLVNVGAVEGDF